MTNYLKNILLLLQKDIRIEFRTKDSFNAMFVFGLLVIVIFNFAFDLSRKETLQIASGILWTAFIFSGILGLNRSFLYEKEDGALEGLLLTPVDRGALFFSKLLSNFCVLFAFEIFLLPFFILFFNLNVFSHIHILLFVMVLGTLGFVSVGTLFSAVAVHTRMREIMLPLLLLPVSVPVLVGAVEATSCIIMNTEWEIMRLWIQRLFFIDVIYCTASFLLFEYVITE